MELWLPPEGIDAGSGVFLFPFPFFFWHEGWLHPVRSFLAFCSSLSFSLSACLFLFLSLVLS